MTDTLELIRANIPEGVRKVNDSSEYLKGNNGEG